jgi:hypothetical protein
MLLALLRLSDVKFSVNSYIGSRVVTFGHTDQQENLTKLLGRFLKVLLRLCAAKSDKWN